MISFRFRSTELQQFQPFSLMGTRTSFDTQIYCFPLGQLWQQRRRLRHHYYETIDGYSAPRHRMPFYENFNQWLKSLDKVFRFACILYTLALAVPVAGGTETHDLFAISVFIGTLARNNVDWLVITGPFSQYTPSPSRNCLKLINYYPSASVCAPHNVGHWRSRRRCEQHARKRIFLITHTKLAVPSHH